MADFSQEGTRRSAAVTVGARETTLNYYEAGAALLTTLPGARRLLRAVAERDLQVVLATSAPENELALLRSTLDCEDVVSAVTSSEDVEQAKPNPGIVEVALVKAGVSADRAVFVGDAVWDVQASGRAGVLCIAVLSGGVSRCELEDAGAAAVFENPEDLCVHLADTAVAALL